ncbi:MAG: hypothetical protein JWM74_2739 [Myxococcaceae bacterium]|nr:hypothetical protein [Myxococcaceae bacterium]
MLSKLRLQVREAWKRLRGGELTPARAAGSVAVGLLVGVTPLWGLHFWIVLAICVPLRLDVPVAYLAANISLPFIAPFLSIAEIEIGARILTGRFLPLTKDELARQGVKPFLEEILIGTAVFAPFMALLGGSITFGVARALARRKRAPSRWLDVFERVAARYADDAEGWRRRVTLGYVRSKLANDPVAGAVLELAGERGLGEVTDVGCGRGQLALVLLEAGRADRVAGFDWDEAKVKEATRAAGDLPARFYAGDFASAKAAAIEGCDTALLVDVLHYLTSDEQDALLRRVADAARARVIVRDLDPDRGWRSTVTRVQEAVTTFVRFNRGARVHVRPIAAATKVLDACGFDAEVTPCWEGTPFANVLLVATRRARAAGRSTPPAAST